MTRLLLAVLFVLLPGGVDAADSPKTPVSIDEMDALRIEKAAVDLELAQTQMQLLEKTLINLQWEATDIKRRLDAAARIRDEEIVRAAKKAGVDPAACRPEMATKTWLCREPAPGGAR